MTSVFAKKALLPAGWADNVRLDIAAGQIDAVRADVTPVGDETTVGYVIPGLCNAHSHAFQRSSAHRQVVTTSGAGESACTNWRGASTRQR